MGSSPSFPIVSLPRERIVVITGANTGIGYEAAKQIAMMGATVIIACRSEQRANDAIKRMNEEYLADKSAGKLKEGHIQDERLPVEFMKLDLASLKSTMEFIEAFKSSGRKLHLLLCNAGVLVPERELTEDGYEKQFQVNYLGHFLIVAHLLPIMKQSGEDCRIVSVSSLGHKYARFDLEKAQCPNQSEYGGFLYYGNSKLYQIQHMSSLSRRLKGSNVSVTSMHPGAISTELSRNYGERRGWSAVVSFINTFHVFNAPIKGATTLIDAAVNPKKKGLSDMYLVDCKQASISSAGRNERYQEDLWKYSLDCLKDYLTEDIISGLEGTT